MCGPSGRGLSASRSLRGVMRRRRRREGQGVPHT